MISIQCPVRYVPSKFEFLLFYQSRQEQVKHFKIKIHDQKSIDLKRQFIGIPKIIFSFGNNTYFDSTLFSLFLDIAFYFYISGLSHVLHRIPFVLNFLLSVHSDI